jgi:hypothetical protein
MRTSSEAFEATDFTLKPTTLPDGRVKIVSPSAPGKEWFGADHKEAIRKATTGLQDAQGARELKGNDPSWMSDGRFSGKVVR